MSVDTIRLIIVLYLIYKFLKWILSSKNESKSTPKKNTNIKSLTNQKIPPTPQKITTNQDNLQKTNTYSSESSNSYTYLNKSKYLHIAGIPHRFGKSVKINTIFSEGQKLTAVRQKNNIHDSNAIQLYLGSQFVGFIPKDQNQELATFMDKGGKLIIKVYRVDPSDIWRGVGIEITPTPF